SESSKMSAYFPVEIVPRESVLFKYFAGFNVAACSACNDVKPAAFTNSNSSWILEPGKQYGLPRSVPASIGIPFLFSARSCWTLFSNIILASFHWFVVLYFTLKSFWTFQLLVTSLGR